MNFKYQKQHPVISGSGQGGRQDGREPQLTAHTGQFYAIARLLALAIRQCCVQQGGIHCPHAVIGKDKNFGGRGTPAASKSKHSTGCLWF